MKPEMVTVQNIGLAKDVAASKTPSSQMNWTTAQPVILNLLPSSATKGTDLKVFSGRRGRPPKIVSELPTSQEPAQPEHSGVQVRKSIRQISRESTTPKSQDFNRPGPSGIQDRKSIPKVPRVSTTPKSQVSTTPKSQVSAQPGPSVVQIQQSIRRVPPQPSTPTDQGRDLLK